MKNLNEFINDSFTTSSINEAKIENIINSAAKDKSFFDKLVNVISDNFNKIKEKVISHIFELYYSLSSNEMPLKDKITIITSLVYLISPIDVIHDYLPIGYTDDIGIIIYIYENLKRYITPEIKEKALNAYNEYFNK